jgi:hypothetical protein
VRLGEFALPFCSTRTVKNSVSFLKGQRNRLLQLIDSMKTAINMAWEHGGGGASHPVTNTYRYKKEPHTCPQSYFVIFLG